MFCCCAADDGQRVAVVDANPANEESLSIVGAGAQEPAQQSLQPEEEQPPASATAAPLAQPKKNRIRAKLTRDSGQAPWGLKVDFADDQAVHICEVRPAAGAVHAYNAEVPVEQQIQTGDYIMSVNGVSMATTPAATASPPGTVAEALREEMKKTVILLEVVRPYIFQVAIDRRGETMGLELNFTTKSTSLIVVNVSAGAAARCAPEIQSGDRIVAVNGDTGEPEKLLEYIRAASDPVTLTMTRPDDA